MEVEWNKVRISNLEKGKTSDFGLRRRNGLSSILCWSCMSIPNIRQKEASKLVIWLGWRA